MTKKAFLVVLLCIISLFSSAFSLKDWKSSLDDKVRIEAEKSFADFFGRKVAIQEAGGVIVGEIILKGFSVPLIGKAEKVILNYNPLDYALHKGDMLPALRKITLINGNFSLYKDKNGQWNFTPILPKEDKNGPTTPIFHGQIQFKHCLAQYQDGKFSIQARELNGSVDLQQKEKISFSIEGKIPENAKLQGSFSPATSQYLLNFSAQKLDLKKWANYLVPFPQFEAFGGTANLNLQVQPGKADGQFASLNGKAAFENFSFQYQNYAVKEAKGSLFVADKSLTLASLKAEINQIPLSLTAKIDDFTQKNITLSVNLKEANLSLLNPFLPKRLTGSARLAFQGNLLSADILTSNLFRGSSSSTLLVEVLQGQPEIELKMKFSKLDLADLSENSPGIEGFASGELVLSGPLDNLSGRIASNFSGAHPFGQPVETLSADFKIADGAFFFEHLVARSKNAGFSSNGKVGADLTFDLKTVASGLRVSGNGLLGKMQATVDSFKGNMRWKVTPQFLTNPLKNIFASGEAVLSNGTIGKQRFERAQGKLKIGNGLIEIENAFLQKGSSILNINGQTGVGHPSNLTISGKNLRLEDLKILNHFLPEEAKDPLGAIFLEAIVTGSLSRETRLKSFDPLLDLSVKGKILVEDASFAQVPVSSAKINFSWEGHELLLSDCAAQLPDSTLTLNSSISGDGRLNALLEGTANLAYFQPLFKSIGELTGTAGFLVKLQGDVKNPILSSSFWVDKFGYNEIYFDRLSGSVQYSKNRLSLLEPLQIKDGKNLYTLAGQVIFDWENPAATELALQMDILEGDLSPANRLFNKIRGEITSRFSAGGIDNLSGLSLPGLNLPFYSQFARDDHIQFYSVREKHFLDKWGSLRASAEKRIAIAPEENLSGSLSGNLRLNGKTNNLNGGVYLIATNPQFRNVAFDKLLFSANLKNQQIEVEKVSLAKGLGSLSAAGNYTLNGDLNLKLSVVSMPLSVLNLVFPDKEFKGDFNLNAALYGSAQNLKFNLKGGSKKALLAGNAFDEIAFSLNKSEKSYSLDNFSLQQGLLRSSARGSFSPDGQMNLNLDLKGNAFGLINLITNDVRWVKGNASLSAKMGGSFSSPKINGKLHLSKGVINLLSLDSDLVELEGSAEVKDNLLQIERLTSIWIGKKTRNIPNPIGLAGSIDLGKIFAENRSAAVNLAFSPTQLNLAFPGLYSGKLSISELSLQGSLNFDFPTIVGLSEGPLLKGKVLIEDSVFSLSQAGGRETKVLPLKFDIEANLAKNTYVAMGDVATLNLSNIFMNLEVAGEGFKILGDLSAPILSGKISIKRGSVNIFNREFTLLSPEFQKNYFPYDTEKIQDNIAIFSGEKGEYGVLPKINITADINVENTEKDLTGINLKKKLAILARLNGTMGAPEAERGLKISLSGFTEDKTKTPPEMLPAAYSESDLKVMLLPDFIKSLAGIGQPAEKTTVDTNLVVADYLSSRVQAFIFRGLEREVEKTLGLESLTLEYNFGPQVREAMGIKEVKGFGEEEKPLWNIGFVKGFFDRLFIDVRYAQGLEQSVGGPGITTFNYQLTYKFSPIWSIIYYREPVSLSEITTGYQKVTLKAGFALW